MIRQYLVTTLLLAIAAQNIQGFISPQGNIATRSVANTRHSKTLSMSSSTQEESAAPQKDISFVFEPVFDFSDPSTIDKFDRIDDAIMGGISTSGMRSGQDEQESFASWSGVCRTDGGGFCGTRTLPFRDGIPLKVMDETKAKDGFYLNLRLVSDNEPQRRVWKLTTRVENNSRTEQLYQAMFEVPAQDSDDAREWKTVRVPFDSFIQVRGPRIVENGPPLDVSNGLFQIGMVMSKFRIAANMTEWEDFRPGFFELQIKDIGVYSSSSVNVVNGSKSEGAVAVASSIDTPQTLTKQEAERNKPAALKILFPILKLFFSEKRSRQKSATRILKERGFSRIGIAKFAVRRRAASHGMVVALIESCLRALASTLRLAAFYTLKLALFYPLVFLRRSLRKIKAVVTPKKGESTAVSPKQA